MPPDELRRLAHQAECQIDVQCARLEGLEEQLAEAYRVLGRVVLRRSSYCIALDDLGEPRSVPGEPPL